MQVIPHCEMRQIGNEIICDYTIERWKLVLSADAELVHLRVQLKNEKRRSASLAQQILLLTGQGKVYAESEKLHDVRVDKLTQDLIDMNLKYENANAKSRFGSPIAWTVAAVAVSVLGGFVIKDFVD